MKFKSGRTIAFYLHRILGLAVGMILILVGLTGSLLVFETEIYSWIDSQRHRFWIAGDRIAHRSDAVTWLA